MRARLINVKLLFIFIVLAITIYYFLLFTLEKNDPFRYDNPIYTNIESIKERFPAIEGITEVKYCEDALGTNYSRIPGPTDYHIYGIISLDEAASEKYFSIFEWQPADKNQIQDIFVKDITDNNWLYSSEFTLAYKPEYYQGDLYFNGSQIYFDITTT